MTKGSLGCLHCGARLDANDFLDGCVLYISDRDALVYVCRACGEETVVEFAADGVFLGRHKTRERHQAVERSDLVLEKGMGGAWARLGEREQWFPADLRVRSLACASCGMGGDMAAFLDGCYSYFPAVDVVYHRCANCGEKSNIRIEPDMVLFGGLYAAGTAHFMAMEAAVLASGRLSATRDGDNLLIELDEQSRIVPAGHNT